MCRVFIGAIPYTVQLVDGSPEDGDDAHLLGQIDYVMGTISVRRGLGQEARRANLWHEIIHGILSQAGHRNDKYEALVTAIGYGLADLLGRQTVDEIEEAIA